MGEKFRIENSIDLIELNQEACVSLAKKFRNTYCEYIDDELVEY